MTNSVTISEELLNHMVDALTYLPHRQVVGILSLLADELSEEKEQAKPQLIVEK